MIQDPFAIVVVLFGVILVSLRLCDRFVWAERVSAVMWILFLAAVASNVGLIPTDAPVYGHLVDFAVPFAVCVILLKVNLADVLSAGKAMLVAFGIASLGTVVGVLLAGLALEPALHRILGDESWKVAGPYTGTYIGGSLNFFALWEGLELERPELLGAANAVDNLTLFPLFAIWILVPTLLGRRFPVAPHWHVATAAETAEHETEDETPAFRPTQLVTLVFIAMLIMWTSEWLKQEVFGDVLPQLPTILIVTTLALAAGQIRPIQRLEGAWELGHLSFYVFFAAVGAMIHIYSAVVLAPILFLYVMIVIAVHMLLVYGAGRALKMDVGVLTIASTAAKAGPPMVLAMVDIKGWKELALPGVLMGLLGYAAGNYVGLATAYVMKVLIGGG